MKADGHGYGRTAERQIVVEAGREASLELVLPPDPGTGVRVSAKANELRLWLDGKEIGPLPQTVGGLTPGEHALRVAGNPRFAPHEQRVLVPAGQMVDVQIVPPVAQGTLHVTAGEGASGAQVYLQVGGERRLLVSLPATLEVQPKAGMSVVATKKGYQEFSRPVEFAPGEPSLTVVVDMVRDTPEPEQEPSSVAATVPAPRRAAPVWRAPAPSKARAPAVEEDPEAAALNADPYAANRAQPAASAGTGKVSVNSIPPSRVTLNGRDIGSTPQIGIEVPAGTVTAVFTHSELGTMTRSGVVKPGGKLTLSVNFNKTPE